MDSWDMREAESRKERSLVEPKEREPKGLDDKLKLRESRLDKADSSVMRHSTP
jgi:hypothetical protein